MANTIYLKADKTFRGPYSDTRTVLPGETAVVLTDPQFAAWDALPRPDPSGLDRERPILFDATASPVFFYASLAQAAAVAPDIDNMLYFQFARIQGDATLDFIRTMLMDLRMIILGYRKEYGPNFGIVRADIKMRIQNALSSGETNTTLLGIQADALSASQWSLP